MFGHLVTHERTQRQLITAMSGLLMEAIATSDGDQEWVVEAKKLFKTQKMIKAEHETRLFNQKNGHAENHTVKVETSVAPETIQPIQGAPIIMPGAQIDPQTNHELNKMEESFGGEMSEEELERMFNQRPAIRATSENAGPKHVDLSKKNPFKGMTLQEIESWEAAQNNSNDIYKIKARVQNLAVGISGGNLTAVGEMMVNSFVHVLRDLYEFADYLPDAEQRIRLVERIRKHEGMPGTLIAAASAGVKVSKK
jgi:hypothetical protein